MSYKKNEFPCTDDYNKKIGGLEFITGGVLSTLYNNGLPYQTFSIDVNATTNLNSIDVFNLSNIDQTNKNFYKSNLFQLRNTNIAYDDNKKLIETSDALTGQHCSLILDKFSENIIATFSNASISGGECGFFDFEDPQNTYNSSIIIDDGHTGLKANRVNGNISGYSYSYSKQFYPTNQTQRYKLSAWVRTQSNYGQTGGKGELVIRAIDNLNNPINTTGAYQVAYIDNTNSQWKYYEAILDYPSVKSLSSNTSGFSVYAVNYNLSDYFDIDDIRIQPLYSECITSTYDQTTALKTSVSDIRSIPNYFEFDHFWREIIFRNSKRQILKEKTYNYGSHICEFWNDDTYAFRKKEDCNNTGVGGSGSNLRPDDYHGFYGSTVTYVVPSYKFSSCVSQKDANDKAQADITSNAQNFANTYGVCLECNDIAHYLDGNVCKPAIRHYWEELCAPIQSPYNTQYPYSTYTHVVIAHEWYEYPDVGVVTPEVITIVQCMP
jgi:hypothetical protein